MCVIELQKKQRVHDLKVELDEVKLLFPRSSHTLGVHHISEPRELVEIYVSIVLVIDFF